MPTYRAFDLHVSSEIHFPELPRSDVRHDGPPDVEVRIGDVDEPPEYDTSHEGTRIRHGDAAIHVAHPRVGVVRVSEGQTVEADPVRDASPEPLRQFLLGTAMRVLLHQRGNLVFHASAVEIDGRVAAFVGESGAGKSTLAAACYAAGHGVVADDVVVLRRDGDDYWVPPAFPSLKLGRSAAERFDLPPVGDDEKIDRRYRSTPRGFPAEPLPLANVYLVEPSAEPEVGRCETGDGLNLLLGQTYSSSDLRDARASASHFEACATVQDALSVRRLDRPETFDRLPDLVELIERDQ